MNQTSFLSSFRLLSLLACVAGLIGLNSSLEAEPIFPQPASEQDVEKLQESVAYLLTLSEEELRERVPVESGGIWFTDCPNCEVGSQDRGRFLWLPEKPHQIECQGCGAIYPDNPDYPDDQFIEVEAPEGVHRFAYWENPEGYRLFFRAHADYLHREYLGTMIRNLGRLYAATGEDLYARPAAILLHRFAEVVPGYAYTLDFPYLQKQFSPYINDRIPNPANHRTSVWSHTAYTDIPRPLLEAYDALRDWDGWEKVAGPETRETVEEDLFTFLVRFVLKFDDPLTNMSPRIWRDAIYAGRLLERPEWVHESVRRFEGMIAKRFLHDGHWYETSPSYHNQTINGMRAVIETAEGYSDPEGYRDPRTGRRFDNLNLAKYFPQYDLAQRALDALRLPDGRLLPVNDTWATGSRAAEENRAPRESSESLVLPGLGVAILGAGAGDEQIFSWLNFTSGTAHKHRDPLAIGLFGFDEEVLPDIGYTHTRYRRAWASSTMAHNTVVVDGREAGYDEEHRGNRLVSFASNEDDFQLAAAESDAAYPGRTERYRRTVILLGDKAGDSYLLDVFEIRGGNQHDYVLHGSADADSTARLWRTDLRPYRATLVNPGVNFNRPETEQEDMGPAGAFSFIQDLQKGTAKDPLRLDLRLTNEPNKGSRTILAPMSDAEVFLGRSPSIRPAAENNAQLNEYFRPSFVMRREGQNLDTIFVAAHEPVDGYAKLHDVRTRRADDRLWISVRHADGRDYISLALGEPKTAAYETSKGDFETDAACAVIRLDRNDGIRSAHLVEGKRLQFRQYELKGPGAFTGKIHYVEGNEPGQTFFDLDRTHSHKNAKVLIVEFPDGSTRSYSVTGIEKTVGGLRVHVREAAGFELRKTEILLTSYPQESIEGTELTYRLIDSAHSE